jgi:hypothetical protein
MATALVAEALATFDHGGYEGKIAALGCEGGDQGCWPILVNTTLRDDVVIWSDFEQLHRAWRYDEVRPLLFDRTRHVSALSQVKTDAPIQRI